MYEWRKMNAEQRRSVLEERRLKQLPWHGPPHFGTETDYYHISAACYEHSSIVSSIARLTDVSSPLRFEETTKSFLRSVPRAKRREF